MLESTKNYIVEDFTDGMATYTRDYSLQTEKFDFSIELIVPKKVPFGKKVEPARVSLQNPGFETQHKNVTLKRESWNVGVNMAYVDTNVHLHRLTPLDKAVYPTTSELISFRTRNIKERGDILLEPPSVFSINDAQVIRYVYEGSKIHKYGIFYQIIASEGYAIGVSHAVIYNAMSEKKVPWVQQHVLEKAEKMISSLSIQQADNGALFTTH
ncbi:hypothetical protein OAP14_08885 [Aliiglaciecola sp.]|nr:hypothetical protein [Aliiglaciecola sp.]